MKENPGICMGGPDLPTTQTDAVRVIYNIMIFPLHAIMICGLSGHI